MNTNELRKKFIEFFESKGHKEIKGAPLLPENDSSVLFTTAGMHPLVPYLMGENHPDGKRLVDYQKCIRTGDIEEVGDATHLTFFEMLGNWSLNDYFKEDSISYSYEFLTKVLNLDSEKIAISVFEGNENAPRDEESAIAWKKMGIKEEKIAYLPKENNWWGPVGETGPCGPDTEIFYWRLNKIPVPQTFDPQNDGWVEIWNNVFMEYNKTKDGYIKAEFQNVDTGMGLERMAAVLQKKENVYETDSFEQIMSDLLSKDVDLKDARIIADHMRTIIFLISDGLLPSNTDQGYVLRRLIRKVVTLSNKYNITLTSEMYDKSVIKLKETYPELETKKDEILNVYYEEREKYLKTISNGRKMFKKIVSAEEIKNQLVLGETAFKLKDTYGLPLEIILDLANEQDLTVDIPKFKELFNDHQEKSRLGAEQKFKGGMADGSYETTKLHTASHLLNAALKQVLGPEVHQMGSNITPERLRFDFPYQEKLTDEQIKKVEDLVNKKIEEGIEIICEEKTKSSAINDGAEAQFIEKYGDTVKVYSIGDFSKEICGGPHAKNTKELGTFRITKEQSASAGVRRIKAILINKD